MAGTTGTLPLGSKSYTIYSFTTDPLADANDYLAASITATTWQGLEDDAKIRLLVSAFRTLERQQWSGESIGSLAWPRSGATMKGAPVAEEIPDDIVEGMFELASFLADGTDSVTSQSTASNIKKVGAGSASVEYFYPLSGQDSRFPLPVQELIGCYLGGSAYGIGGLAPYVGGQDGTLNQSTFTDLDTGLTNGFA